MGLLDGIETDPQVAMGMGLLSAGGNSRMPVSLGQALGSGYKDMQSTAKEAQALAMQKLQMSALMRRQYMVDSALAQENGQPPPSPEHYGLPAIGGIPSSTVSAPSSSQPQAPSAPPFSANSANWTPGKISAFSMSGDPGLMKAAELAQARLLSGQTDITKLIDAAGITDPGLRAQLIQSHLAKQNYVAPVNARPGSIIRDPMDPSKVLAFNPHIPDGGTPVFGPGGVVTGVAPLAGATDVMGAAAAAQQSGKNTAEPMQAWNPVTKQFEFTSKTAAARGGLPPSSGAMRPGLINLPPEPAKPEDLAAIDKELAVPSLSPRARAALIGERANIVAGLQGGTNAASAALAPAPAPGIEAGATNAQSELTKKYSALQEQNSQAQITSSYLQNIKEQAKKAAVGPLSDRIDYVNGLISLLPGNQERATNAVTANDLLDKYSNQIVSRLGQGGLGTDAARAILQSAYPNAHMNLAAINEAADNLVGSNEMVKAKAALLSPHGNARDPVAYQQKEMVFDQNADPRLWQYKAMTPGSPEAKAFLQSVIKQDPQFLKKAQNLRMIGAF